MNSVYTESILPVPWYLVYRAHPSVRLYDQSKCRKEAVNQQIKCTVTVFGTYEVR